MTKKLLLQAHFVTKSYFDPKEIRLFTDICIDIERTDAVAIMGASGEGKSTLLHILGTLEHPTSGSIRIADNQVSKRNAPALRNAHIGFVFQSFHLLEDYSTLENVLMPARIAGKDTRIGSKAYKRALSLLDKVGLLDRAHFRSKLLSGGEKQRVAIARALCNDPELILADEPSGNLDPITSKTIHELLLSLAKEQNKGLIVVTHDLELAALCDRIYTLQDKQLHLRVK